MSEELHELNSKIAHCISEKDRTTDVKLMDREPFSKMLLADNVRKGLNEAGFLYPTIIQANAIPIGKAGIDLLVQSKSGTGKTLIYCTVLLELYQNTVHEPQSLIIVPTREIAVQIESVLNKIGKFSTGFKAISVIGGLEVTDDRKKIQGAKAIVGTPGRLLHLIKNQILNTSQIKLLILDEADKLMNHTFYEDFIKIENNLPINKQVIACSATFGKNIELQLAKYMNNPLLITTERHTALLVGIKQFVYDIPEEKTSIAEMESKLTALKNIFSKIPFNQCLAFASSQSRADSYRNCLEKRGWSCEIISGAQHQKTRLEMFKKFQDFKTRILISTDLMSRGIDSANVNLVINLEIPNDAPTYLHRIGRAGRFGTHGIAITFIASGSDRKKFSQILDKIDPEINVYKFPQNSTSFLDIMNFEKEFELFSIHDSKENLKNNENNIQNSNGNINTNTYNIEYEKDTFANKIVLTETLNSDHIVPSSNTIDDASSIAVDSDFLQSNSSMGSYDIVVNPTFSPISLLEMLIDNKKNNGNVGGIDLFEDYRKTLERETISENSIAKKPDCADWKTLLLDAAKATKTKDIFSEYEKFVQNNDNNSSCSSKTKECELNSSIKPQISNHNNLILTPNLLIDVECSNLEESSQEIQIPHFPSPRENIQLYNCSTQNFKECSSGFDEKSSDNAPSSDNVSNGSASYYTSSINTFENAKNSFDTSNYNNNEEEYETSSSSSSTSLMRSENPKQYDDMYENDFIYQNAYARWTNLYWNQMTFIQDYAKFSTYVKQNPN